jgi:hypothetical protein
MARKTTVVHMREDYDVYIGRPSKWGNPYSIGRHGTRDDVIRLYRIWLRTQPCLLKRIPKELKGKRLGCYCHPQSCHGDVLAKIANEG